MTDIKYPKGIKKGSATQLAVRFDTKVFDSIMKRAKREERTFNEMVMELCKCGELCLWDSDRHEPKRGG
jgi:hypothetical protein